jgi:hypothetical protein
MPWRGHPQAVRAPRFETTFLIERMNRRAGSSDLLKQGYLPAGPVRGPSNGMAQMRQARSFAVRPAAIEATTALAAPAARRDGAPVNAAWAPPGYDATDLRILEWITAHRRSRRAQAKTILAA